MSEIETKTGLATEKTATRQRMIAVVGPVALALVTFGFDQLTKEWALRVLSEGDITLIPNVLFFDLAYNPGAAFSMFSGYPGALSALATILSLVIIVWIWKVALECRITAFALGAVLGGAVGNLVDRIRFQQVTDFIRVHFAVIDWSWPTFNVADSSICIGMAVLLYITFFPRKIGNEKSSS